MIGVRGDLRQVGDHERLPVAPTAPAGRPPARHRGERRADPPAHFPTDPLVHLVEHESRNGVVLGEHDLEREHQP